MNTDSVDRALLYSLWAGIFLLLFVPLIISTSTIFPFIVGKAIYAHVIISVLFGLWLILAFINPLYRLPGSWILAIFAIYLFISLLSGVFGVSFQRSLWSTYERMQGVVDLAYWLALTIVVSSVVRSMFHWRILLNINLGIGLLIALFGVAQSQDISNPLYGFIRVDERLGVTLGNPAFVATYMMINGLLALGLLAQSFGQEAQSQGALSQARRRRRRRRDREDNGDNSAAIMRAFWIAVVLLNVWVMTLTGTRGAIVGMAAGLAAFAAVYIAIGDRRAVKVAAFGLVGAIVAAVLLLIVLRDTPIVTSISSSNILVRRFTDIRLDDDTVQSRLLALSVGAQSLGDRPILGWGPENYIVAFGRYYTRGASTFEILDQAHNKPVEELVTRGVLGLVSYMAIWIFMFVVIWRKLKIQTPRDQILLLAVGATLVAYFVQNLFLFDTPATMLLFILLVAFVVSLDNSPVSGDGGRPLTDSEGESKTGVISATRRLALQSLSAYQERPSVFFLNYYLARSRLLGLLVLVAGLALVAWSLNVNLMAWHGATSILKINSQQNTVSRALEIIDESINAFPPLANRPRTILFANIPEVWSDLSHEDRERMRLFLDEQAVEALAAEPENWQFNLQFGNAYRVITEYDPRLENIEIAQSYALEALRLAPERRDVIFLVNRLADVEERIRNKQK